MMGYRTQPEPFASMVDIITAAQYIEAAIHASSGEEASKDLQLASDQMLHAKAYFDTASSINNLYKIVYSRLSAQAGSLSQELITMSNNVKNMEGTQLANYQAGTIYPFQGKVRLLYFRVQKLMAI